MCEDSHIFTLSYLIYSSKVNKNNYLLCDYSHMTTAEQLGSQIRAARGQLSLRALSDQVDISPSTLGEYERGVKVPEADKLARIADALNHFTFRVDDFTFTVSRADAGTEPRSSNEQLPLDFSGEYSYAKASVKIRPGRISVVFDGVKAPTSKLRLTASSN
jgi:transcriptional regulator with XRE-family HTH domain